MGIKRYTELSSYGFFSLPTIIRNESCDNFGGFSKLFVQIIRNKIHRVSKRRKVNFMAKFNKLLATCSVVLHYTRSVCKEYQLTDSSFSQNI